MSWEISPSESRSCLRDRCGSRLLRTGEARTVRELPLTVAAGERRQRRSWWLGEEIIRPIAEFPADLEKGQRLARETRFR